MQPGERLVVMTPGGGGLGAPEARDAALVDRGRPRGAHDRSPRTRMSAVSREVDLLVLGSGAGGMTAALTAAILGLDVMVVEKAEFVGGTSARSAGSVWVPNSRHSPPGSDDPEQGPAYLRAALGNRLRESMVLAFLRAGPEMIEFLEDNSAVAFRAYAHHPDYLATLRARHSPAACWSPCRSMRRCLASISQPAPAAAGIHVVRRHDGRSHRHRPSAERDEVARVDAAVARRSWPLRRTVCASAAARGW